MHLVGWILHVCPASILIIMITVDQVETTIYQQAPSLQSLSNLKHSKQSQSNSNQFTIVAIFSINYLHQPNQLKSLNLTILHPMSFDDLSGLEMQPEETTFSWTSDSSRPGWWISDYFGVQTTGIGLLRLATRHLQTDSQRSFVHRYASPWLSAGILSLIEERSFEVELTLLELDGRPIR